MRFFAPRLGLPIAAALSLCAAGLGQINVRVATYNIQFLNKDISAGRKANLQSVLGHLSADVIALEEIADRPALQAVFNPQDWILVIDDDSADPQDVALAVRRPWQVEGVAADLDADDGDFLFPAAADNSYFPNRRDVLAVKVKSADGSATFTVMVVHAKSRLGGRSQTDPRRVGHAAAIVNVIKTRYDDSPFVLLGDFNDNPDDQALNVLETGDVNALGGPENIDGPLCINLTESLLLEDRVSEGLKPDSIHGDQLDTIDAGSRARNNTARGTNQNTGKILFDQILIPAWWSAAYMPGSVHVYDRADAIQGAADDRASDHVPVYADFVVGSDSQPGPGPTALFISGLVPNPIGPDDNHEQVTISNPTATPADLSGWKVKDSAGNEYPLTGTVPAQAELTVTMQRSAMLNNSGDTVALVNPAGQQVQVVSYSASQAQPGARIAFPPSTQ